LDLRLRRREFNSGQVAIKWLLPGGATVCEQLNHLVYNQPPRSTEPATHQGILHITIDTQSIHSNSHLK